MPTTRISGPALLCALLAVACGGAATAPGPGVSTTRVALVSTVPAPGATNDRWADLHFTFSAPVDWTGLVYADCTSPGCRIAKVPYRFTSTGAEVVGTPILPPEPGQSYSLLVTPLLSNPTDPCPVPGGFCTAANINFSWSTLPAATTVSSDVTADTTLALSGSPYYFAPGVLVRAALTIPAGVEVIGDVVATGAGSVTAIGTPTQHIRISTAVFAAPGRLSYVDLLNAVRLSAGDVDHASIYCGRLADGTPSALELRISGSLTDSRVSGCKAPSLHGEIARNVFLGTYLELGGSTDGHGFGSNNLTNSPPPTPWDATTSFVDNYVRYGGGSDTYSVIAAGAIWLTASTGTITGNTFAGFNQGSCYLYPENNTAATDLAGNFWGGADAATVATYFRPGYPIDVFANGLPVRQPPPPQPTIDPMLASPDPATPTP